MFIYIFEPVYSEGIIVSYERIGVIDEVESILWNPKYNDIGSAEIYASCDASYLELLRRGNYLYRDADEMFCKIEQMEITTDAQEGDYIIATAVDISNILSGRIIRDAFAFSGKVVDFVKKVLVDNVISPSVEKRKIPNFRIDDSNFNEFTETIDTTIGNEDIGLLIIATCKAYNYGFKTTYDEVADELVFKLYKGKNKASMDSDEYIEFSPEFANLISSNYKEDESLYKNIVYVSYLSADEQVYLLSMFEGAKEPQGEGRREIFVDGTGTSREVTLDVLRDLWGTVKRYPATQGTEIEGYYYTGTDTKVATFEIKTTDGVSEEKLIATDNTYLKLIRIIGKNALMERVRMMSFTGEVDTVESYEYKKDYSLGDIVRVKNEYGLEAEARIVEIMESEDANNGYVCEPKFEF